MAPFPVLLWARRDDDFVVADVNDAACAFLMRSREACIGATADELGGSSSRGRRDMAQALRTGQVREREIPYVVPSGEVRRLRIFYAGIGDEVLAFIIDMTHQRSVEERLRLTEDRYRRLIATVSEGVWLVEPGGRTRFANTRVGEILGRRLTEIARRNLLDFVDDRDRAAVAAALESPSDVPDAFEACFRTAAGDAVLCLFSVSPMSADGATEGTLCLLADMTALQRERRLRQQTEQRFQRMVETANEGVWTGDRHGRTTFVNDAAALMLGIDPNEMLGQPFADFVVYDDKARASHDLLVTGGQPIRDEFRLRRADGQQIDVMASVSLQRDDDGEVVGALAMLTDVTELKREQAELRESRERFAQVFEEASVGMAFIGAGHLVRGRFFGANRAFRDLLGYSESDLLDRDVWSVTNPEDVEREQALMTALFDNQRSDYAIDKRFVRADGTSVWARFRVHVLRDERGAPLYALGLAADISAEKSAMAVAADAEARAAAVLAGTSDAVLELRADGSIADANGAGLRMLGMELAELVGKPLVSLAPERLQTRFTDVVADWVRAAEAGEHVEPTETTLTRADGSEFPASLRINAVANDGGVLLVMTVRNLALQDRAEASRREAEERFERLFRDSPLAAATLDLRGGVTDANPAFCTLTGRDLPGLIGRDADEVLAEPGDACDAPWRAGAERPGPQTAARRVVRPDGSGVGVRVTASLVRDAAGVPVQWLCQCRASGPLVLDRPTAEVEPLSYRERQVLGLLASGHDGPAIAKRLGLSSETVRSYAQSARSKLGARTRTHAVALALARGEISI